MTPYTAKAILDFANKQRDDTIKFVQERCTHDYEHIANNKFYQCSACGKAGHPNKHGFIVGGPPLS